MPVFEYAPNKRLIGATRSICPAAAITANALRRAARLVRSISIGAIRSARQSSTRCSICGTSHGSRNTIHRRAILPRATTAPRKRRPPQRSRRSKANSRSRSSSTTKRRSVRIAARRRKAAHNASTCARRRRFDPMAITSQSSHTFAWAAAHAPRCARRARCPTPTRTFQRWARASGHFLQRSLRRAGMTPAVPCGEWPRWTRAARPAGQGITGAGPAN